MNKRNWDYKRPNNLWESMPWFIRWPVGVLIFLYFLAGFLLPFVGTYMGKI